MFPLVERLTPVPVCLYFEAKSFFEAKILCTWKNDLELNQGHFFEVQYVLHFKLPLLGRLVFAGILISVRTHPLFEGLVLSFRPSIQFEKLLKP